MAKPVKVADWPPIRISPEHLRKVRELARQNERSTTSQLHVILNVLLREPGEKHE